MSEVVSNPNNAGSDVVHDRDAMYYLMPITIKVEDTLFKLPRHSFMQHSPIFRDMFMVPQPAGVGGTTQPVDGSSDAQPLELAVSKTDFRYLLEVLFPLDIPPSQNLPKEGWIAVLKLSNMWEMDKVRELAITKLTACTMDSIEKILLSREYHVPAWLRSGYQEFVDREAMLSDDDCQKISYRSATQIFRIREDKLRRQYRGNYGTPALTIETEFKDELASEDAFFTSYSNRSML
ncbi:hypothetical protein H0H81_009268 [Sphagnurus paluster]|uniref:BTB domain-containing protein n=1 Tax=Sphagnurus paluster TaxID=117069 RepID=A0A9P7K4E5_9AGAR|nr:hypothetical protein H0H81_009268 [Sphagnurus paluster]